jgi:hypothetical protein
VKKTGFFGSWALALISAALPALLLASCTWKADIKEVDYDMRGTWECMEEAWLNDYTLERGRGRLVLDSDTITITGPVAHLKDFTRNTPLEVYTEEAEDGTGQLYIKDRGILQSPVSYRRWQSGGTSKDEMLTFPKGGDITADETLKKVGN